MNYFSVSLHGAKLGNGIWKRVVLKDFNLNDVNLDFNIYAKYQKLD